MTSEDIDTETTADAFIEKMLKRQEDIKSIAGENIKKSQKKQKECYDKRHSPEVYNYTALYIYTGCMQVYTLAHSCVRMLDV